MKILKYILLLLPMLASAQLYLSAGAYDAQKRADGNTIAWKVGYDKFIGKIGLGALYRYSGGATDNFYSPEVIAKFRIGERAYRLDLGGGAGMNLDTDEIYPLMTVRNSFRIGEGTWLAVDFEHAFNDLQITYLTAGFAMDITRIGQRKLKKIKRFY